MKFSWLTDIHLNFIDEQFRQKFYQEIVTTKCDGMLISGDIAEAPCLSDLLSEMANYIKKPVYYVLGNHDYYRGRITEVRDAMGVLTEAHNHLFWLPASGVQQLNNNTVLVGQDGWADGRLGDYQNSLVALNDSRMIYDLFQEKILGKFQLLKKMQQLADADAMALHDSLVKSIGANPKKIIVLTHVPPFREACMHEGKISDDDWLPYFSSKAMGDVLMKVAQEYPSIDFLVLCGHTHGKAEFRPLGNLVVEAGGAEYGQPTIQKVISI